MHQQGSLIHALAIPLLLSSYAAVTNAGSNEVDSVASRLAVVSAVDTPMHEGFALAVHVTSDRLCLKLAQDLAAEIGNVVRLTCTDTATGATSLVAECGYAGEEGASEVGRYSRGWTHDKDPYLICVAPSKNRFPSRRVVPDLTALQLRR